MPRLRSISLNDEVEDGSAITRETVKRVGENLIRHVWQHDLSISVGSTADQPEALLVSADVFEDDLSDAFEMTAARFPKVLTAVLSYVKITNRPVVLKESEEDGAEPWVVVVVHPDFDRRIYAEFAAHERQVRTQPFDRIEGMVTTLSSAVERIEGDLSAVRRLLEDQVLPELRN